MKKRLTAGIVALAMVLSLFSTTAFAAELSLDDVRGHWCEDCIVSLVERGAVKGYPDGTIRPDATIARSEFACLLCRLLDLEPGDADGLNAPDARESWAAPYFSALAEAGVLLQEEYGGALHPDAPVTRMEMARMLVRAIGRQEAALADKGGTTFKDDASIPPQDKGYVNAAKKYDLIYGYPDNCFQPDGSSTRAEAFAVLFRYPDAKEKAEQENKKPNQDSGHSGGSSYTPRAEIKLTVPEYGYTDTTLAVTAATEHAASVSWAISMQNADGGYDALVWADACTGELTQAGGNIQIAKAGRYRLTATALNGRGRETTATADFVIAEPGELILAMAGAAHTDTDVAVSVHGGELAVTWQLTRDGEAVELDGTLTDTGGTLRFSAPGLYTLKAVGADAHGRSYEAAANIKIYPVPAMSLSLPDTLHTGDRHTVVPVHDDLTGCTWEWSLTRDGEETALVDCISGELTGDGGTVRFTQAGAYVLTFSAADETGRVFTVSGAVTVLPNAAVSFTMPDTAHTDTVVTVETELSDVDEPVVWSLTRDGVAAELSAHLSGGLTDAGGAVRYTDSGSYVLTAAYTDSAGKVFSCDRAITVFPVPTLSFELPATLHTGDPCVLKVEHDALDGLDTAWSLTRDGEAVEWSACVSGRLDADGGEISFFAKGRYTLTLAATDQTGRTFTAAGSVAVLPNASMEFIMQETAHTDTGVPVETSFAEIEGAAEWTLAYNGAPVPLPDYTTGELTNAGGTLQFTCDGNYTLTAAYTDSSGKEFSHSSTITVYPVPVLSFELPAALHTDDRHALAVEHEHLDGLEVAWSLTRSGEAVALADYVDGALTADGGKIRFTEKGVYALTAAVTDATGRTFSHVSAVTVYPVAEVGFYLPEIAHTDTQLTVETSLADTAGPVVWSLARNGEAVALADYVDGALTDEGGTVRYTQKGSYTLTASYTDGAGRVYAHSCDTEVYPVPQMTIRLPATGHTDTVLQVETAAQEMDGLTAEWVLDNTYGFQDWATFASGTLTNGGGRVRLTRAGIYELGARVTDATGRVFFFTAENKTEILPVLSLSFTLPATAYTDTVLNIRTRGNNNMLPVSWTATRDGAGVSLDNLMDGSLTALGGDVSLTAPGVYELTATMTDALGRGYTHSESVEVYPLLTPALSMPETAFVGEAVLAEASYPATHSYPVSWSLTCSGAPADLSACISAPMTDSGGVLTFPQPGEYTLTAELTGSMGRTFTGSRSIQVSGYNCDFTAPATVHIGSPFRVEVGESAMLGGETVIWSLTKNGAAAVYGGSLGNSGGKIYINEAGSYTLTAAITDPGGRRIISQHELAVTNTAPSTPVISRTPGGNSIDPGTPITITATASDPDGDDTVLIWDNRDQATQVYPLGKQVVRVKAVDAWGAESPWAAVVFFVSSSTNGGGMTLTGPDSTIIEDGLESATITEYTFTVPPVSGHNGDDYGQVWAYKEAAGEWEQVNYGTTTNGITLTGTLEAGVYTKLKMYYYTNHNCMYNKSNITYSVTFDYAV